MAAFNPMEGLTVAKNPWRNSSFGKGTHYFKTSTPRNPNTAAQQSQRDAFRSARASAASACSGETGMSRAECIAASMREQLS